MEDLVVFGEFKTVRIGNSVFTDQSLKIRISSLEWCFGLIHEVLKPSRCSLQFLCSDQKLILKGKSLNMRFIWKLHGEKYKEKGAESAVFAH